jgi:uncharacterized protein (DUF1697 family)
MTVWIALLKGVNVGGHHILPMKDFAKNLQQAGFDDVRTYIQSGNVVFKSAIADRQQLSGCIGDTIHKSSGFRVNVFVLNATELETVAAKNPYPAAEAEPKSLHAFFLASAPKKSALKVLDGLKTRSESFAVIGKVLYLHAPDGIARSKLAAGTGKALGVDATARNWRTVCKLLEIASSLRSSQ